MSYSYISSIPGYGIGSFLGGLFRFVVPLIKKGSVAVGKELLRSSADIVDDITSKSDRVSFEEAVKKRGGEAVKNLKRKAVAKMQTGSGVGGGSKAAKKQKTTHSSSKSSSVKKSSKSAPAKNNIKKKKQQKEFDYI